MGRCSDEPATVCIFTLEGWRRVSPETFVLIYQTTRCYLPEDRNRSDEMFSISRRPSIDPYRPTAYFSIVLQDECRVLCDSALSCVGTDTGAEILKLKFSYVF